jgi:hypothetical protein
MWFLPLLVVAAAFAQPQTLYAEYPSLSETMPTAFHDGQSGYLIGPLPNSVLVTRTAFIQQDDSYKLLSYGLPYRRDRQLGTPDTVINGVDQTIIDIVDPTLPPLVTLGPDDVSIQNPWATVGDVDGDGTNDLRTHVSDRNILLMSTDNPRVVPYPAAITLDRTGGSRSTHVPDLNGDGHGEFWDVLETTVEAGFTVTGVTATLFDGSPNGLLETPRFSVDLDMALLDTIALQADADPELELLALGGDYAYFYDTFSEARVQLIDDTHLTTPTVTSAPGVLPVLKFYSVSPAPFYVANLGDVDGDGLDDVFLRHNEVAHILSSVYGYEIDRPIAEFSLGIDPTDHEDLEYLPFDIDADGHIDLIASYHGSGINKLMVWFGPLAEPTPIPVPHTGDTGASSSTGHTGAPPIDDTGSLADSAHTAHTGHTANTDTAAKAPAAGALCACQHGAPTGMLLLAPVALIARRRPLRCRPRPPG